MADLSPADPPSDPSPRGNKSGWQGTGPLVFANILVVLAVLAQWLYAAWTGDLRFRGHAIGLDFVNTWLGAKLALAGDVSLLFDFSRYNTLLKDFFGADFPDHMWSYPPHLLPLVAPLGAIGYVPAYALWCLLTGLLFWWGCRAVGFRGADLLLLISSPAVAMNIVVGQTGALTAGCLLLALGYAARRPILAGVAAAVLTVKPQFGLLLPIAWLCRRRFAAIAVAIITTLILGTLSVALFGLGVWQGFIDITLPAMRAVMLSGELAAAKVMQPNWSTGLILLGLPRTLAVGIQSIVSLFVIGWWLRLTWKARGASDDLADQRSRQALLLMVSVLATPYIHNYDLVLMAPVVIWAWRDPALSGLPPRWQRLLLILVWLLPWIIIPLHQARIILGPILLTALTVLLLRQAERQAISR